MIFKQWQQVLDGTKTQTRRICKPNEVGVPNLSDGFMSVRINNGLPLPHRMTGKLKWRAQKCYAVQPGRGKPAIWYDERGENTPPAMFARYMETFKGDREKALRFLKADRYVKARIRLLSIRRECVQDISGQECFMEGVKPYAGDWWETDIPPGQYVSNWGSSKYAYDPDDSRYLDEEEISIIDAYARLWDSINTRPGTRWADNPECWVLTFELVKEPTA